MSIWVSAPLDSTLPENVVLVDHPIALDALRILRDENTSPQVFRQQAKRITPFLVAKAMEDYECDDVVVQSPMGPAHAHRILDDSIVVVSVLRAGLGMLDGILEMIPQARVGYIGLQRDESTAIASQYYSKLPRDIENCYVLLDDPMLASAGSAIAAIQAIMEKGVPADGIAMLCVVASRPGVETMAEKFPQVKIYTPVVDPELDVRKYIVPGLGDFGDRLYGTF